MEGVNRFSMWPCLPPFGPRPMGFQAQGHSAALMAANPWLASPSSSEVAGLALGTVSPHGSLPINPLSHFPIDDARGKAAAMFQHGSFFPHTLYPFLPPPTSSSSSPPTPPSDPPHRSAFSSHVKREESPDSTSAVNPLSVARLLDTSPLKGEGISCGSCSGSESTSTEAEGMEMDEGTSRTLRKRRKPDLDGTCCPSCGLTVLPGEAQKHLQAEMEKLDRPSKKTEKAGGSGGGAAADSRYQTYLRIKANREARLHAKSRRKRREEDEDDAVCPVCDARVAGTPDEIATHVDACVRRQRRQSGLDDTSEAVDVEGSGSDEGVESYVWAGQARLRASSFLPPGSLPETVRPPSPSEQDVCIVDVDNKTSPYGAAQYTEADVIPCAPEQRKERKEQEALREAMIGGEGRPRTPEREGEARDQGAPASPKKCLVCMDVYSKPVVSMQCWHVYCETCWLRTLGARKLCPQCKAITTPQDLRKIFM